MDKYAYEVRLLRCESVPRSAKRRRWRWDVIVQAQVDGNYTGVKDARVHMSQDCGYTFTRAGALLEIGKAYDMAQKRFPIYG